MLTPFPLFSSRVHQSTPAHHPVISVNSDLTRFMTPFNCLLLSYQPTTNSSLVMANEQNSIVTFNISLRTKLRTVITIHTPVADVPLLLLFWFDVCSCRQLILYMDADTLKCKHEGRTKQLHHTREHLHCTWDLDAQHRSHSAIEYVYTIALFSLPELCKRPYKFFHLSTQKLYSLIQRARPKKLAPATQKNLKEISQECATYTKFPSELLRF